MKKFLLFLVLVFPVAGQAQPDLGSDLQALLESNLKANPSVPGISLFVICPPLDLQWAGGSGTISHQSTEPMSASHTFRTASNTKTYVAASILRLVEEGHLTLDDSLAGHLPRAWAELLTDDGYDLQAITLRMVLSHTAGLNDHASDDRYGEAIMADPQHRWTADEQIGLLVQWFDPVGAPGEKFSYSDDGYIILGRIIELKTGLSLGVAVRQLLDFDGLGLKNTWWEVMETTPASAGPRAHQYFGELDTIDWDPSLDLYGGGGLLCDARDLALFTRLLVKGKVLHSEAMLAEMTGSGTSEYRLGIFCTELQGRLGWGHSGFWNTIVYHLPSLDLTVSVCVLNHQGVRGVEVVKQVVALLDKASS